MIDPKKLLLVILPVTATLLFATQSHATNGYFSHGTSVAEKGLAGAGVAYSQDTLSAANNPAGMVWQGDAWDIGAALFSPVRSYTVTGPGSAGIPLVQGTYDSDNELFVIPQFGYNWAIGDKRTIGISVYGNGGMNTEYAGGTARLNDGMGTLVDQPGTYGAGTAGVDFSQLFFSTTYSAKFSERGSWGISAIVAYQQFSATGMSNFGGFSSDPSNLSNAGTDSAVGLGLRLGVQVPLGSRVMFGAAYQPEIDMSEFDKYAGLFAEKGDFDVPENYTVGLAWNIAKTHTLVFDIQQINYSGVAAVGNPIKPLTDNNSCMPGPTGGTGSGCLGGSAGAGFGWEDMTIYKLGYEWQSSEKWAWRVGYSLTDQPIPNTEMLFNIIAPGVIEEHLTFGFTRNFKNNNGFNFALMYAPSVKVSGPNTFDPSQTIQNEMYQYELAFSYSKHF
jgi:long-chain fatty acid transport protein